MFQISYFHHSNQFKFDWIFRRMAASPPAMGNPFLFVLSFDGRLRRSWPSKMDHPWSLGTAALQVEDISDGPHFSRLLWKLHRFILSELLLVLFWVMESSLALCSCSLLSDPPGIPMSSIPKLTFPFQALWSLQILDLL